MHEFYNSKNRPSTGTAQFTHFFLLESIEIIDTFRIWNELLIHKFVFEIGLNSGIGIILGWKIRNHKRESMKRLSK